MTFPQELIQICEFLNEEESLHLSQGSGDARRDSADNESKIIQLLQNESELPRIKGANIGQKNDRGWYDFSVDIGGDSPTYVDLKISTMESHADNTNCISAIYFVLTGKTPPTKQQDMITQIKDNIQENDNDFYFLVINKNYSTSELPKANLVSLRTIKKVVPSGNNLPFQCVWKNNLEPHPRTYSEAKEFLLTNYGESLKRRAAGYLKFKDCFPEYTDS